MYNITQEQVKELASYLKTQPYELVFKLMILLAQLPEVKDA